MGPWWVHGVFTVGPWWVHGASVVGRRCLRGGSTLHSCVGGVPMVFPWGNGRDLVVGLSWWVLGTLMVPPRWIRDVSTVGL